MVTRFTGLLDSCSHRSLSPSSSESIPTVDKQIRWGIVTHWRIILPLPLFAGVKLFSQRSLSPPSSGSVSTVDEQRWGIATHWWNNLTRFSQADRTTGCKLQHNARNDEDLKGCKGELHGEGKGSLEVETGLSLSLYLPCRSWLPPRSGSFTHGVHTRLLLVMKRTTFFLWRSATARCPGYAKEHSER
jgi:hypothetical protein